MVAERKLAKGMQCLFDLSGKTALITGCDQRLGKAMALAGAGANIIAVIHSLRSSPSDLSSQVYSLGRKFSYYTCDFEDRKALEGFALRVLKDNPDIDILVNSAERMVRKPIIAQTDDHWDKVLRVNLDAPFLLTREIGRRMLQQGKGKVIFTASAHDFSDEGGIAGYAASKGAVENLTHAFACEWAKSGINVNAIAPDNRGSGNIEDVDLSGALIFLASRASDQVNGVILPVKSV